MILLSTAYLPPIQYMSKFLCNKPVCIEKHENYQKQSYRNRCCIYGANGRQCLIIPVVKHHGEKTPIDKVEIDYKMNWQKVHLKSIESAYRLSAFYEYYADDFRSFYEIKEPYLFQWNLVLLKNVLMMLGIDEEPKLSDRWERASKESIDYRQIIHPKKRMEKSDPYFNNITYQQTFIERFGFIPNLSIIDLIFNEGPQALPILEKSLHSTPAA